MTASLSPSATALLLVLCLSSFVAFTEFPKWLLDGAVQVCVPFNCKLWIDLIGATPPVMKEEVSFLVLDGAMIALAVASLYEIDRSI